MGHLPHKVTRICWNSNHWAAPSGNLGKSKNKNSFEKNYGFGFEEWNFDFSKVIDEYVYGYISAASSTRLPTKVDSAFTLSLYTIESQKRYNQRWWVGTINKVEIINEEKSKEIYAIYEKNGWIKERFEHLKKLDIDYSELLDTFPEKFFNIRYKLKDINLLRDPISFNHKNSAVTSNYYNFLNFTTTPSDIVDVKNIPQKESFSRKTYTIEEATFQKTHSVVHNLLTKDLLSKFSPNQIFSEYILDNNTRVDIAIKDSLNSFILYEIKISLNLRDAIRQSIGQLLEYSFSLEYKNIKEMIIVSIFDIDDPINLTEKKFINSLQQYFEIPISYHYVKIENS